MKHVKSINEWRQQLEIPFDSKGKPAHINVLDGLLDIQTKTKVSSYKSNKKIEPLIEDAENIAFDYFSEGFDDEYMQDVFSTDFLEEYDSIDLYTDNFVKDVTETITNGNGEQVEEIMKLSDILDVFVDDYSSDISDILNKKGQQYYEKYERDRLFDHFQDGVSDFQYNIGTDYDGLIDIWRVITYNKKESEPGSNDSNKDEYHEIISRGNVGKYWSWDKDAAEPHWGMNGGINLVLHGSVKPENINWIQTVYKNVYGLKDESEIEVIKGKEILLYDVTTYVNYSNDIKQASLGIEPMIVKA